MSFFVDESQLISVLTSLQLIQIQEMSNCKHVNAELSFQTPKPKVEHGFFFLPVHPCR